MDSPDSAPPVTFERLPLEYYPERTGFRPGTQCFSMPLGFLFMNGGAGDYITWMQPIRWLASETTWIKGTVYVPDYFRELAEYWLRPFPSWRIKTFAELHSIPEHDKTPLRGPLILQNESLNATGAHLLECGWVYFTNRSRGPDSWDTGASRQGWHWYPPFKQADLDAVQLPEAAQALTPGRYIVVTTGQTGESRKVPAQYWNHVIEHVVQLGYTPVFIGKRESVTGNLKNVHTVFPKELRFDLGVNLLDQTSLLQAASIMSRAACVVGHDNGMLHLAGCTEVPIVFGYNLASPEHRRPLRPVGKTIDITLTPQELACIHCQSNTNFVIGYAFTRCFYGDNKCIDILFADQARRWKDGINEALGR